MKVTCDNCILNTSNRCDGGIKICRKFDMDESTLSMAQCIEMSFYAKEYKRKEPFRLDPIANLELTKAMMGRGVDYNVANQIISDFHKRMERFKK